MYSVLLLRLVSGGKIYCCGWTLVVAGSWVLFRVGSRECLSGNIFVIMEG